MRRKIKSWETEKKKNHIFFFSFLSKSEISIKVKPLANFPLKTSAWSYMSRYLRKSASSSNDGNKMANSEQVLSTAALIGKCYFDCKIYYSFPSMECFIEGLLGMTYISKENFASVFGDQFYYKIVPPINLPYALSDPLLGNLHHVSSNSFCYLGN